MEIAAPVVATMSQADEATHAVIKLEPLVADGKISLALGSLVLTGEKV